MNDEFFSELVPSASRDAPDWADVPFLARLTSVVTPSSGAQNGLNLYGFIEQNFDTQTGLPIDAVGGRQDDLQTNSTCYALELDNRLVPGLTSTPATAPVLTAPFSSPLTVPFVEMRLRGIVGGAPIYEFQMPQTPPALAWVQITSPATPTTITLASGTVTGFEAVIVTQNLGTGAWTSGATVWFLGPNNEVPLATKRYQCRLFTNDTSGVAIWEQTLPTVQQASVSQSGALTLSTGNNDYLSLSLPTGGTYLILGGTNLEVIGSTGDLITTVFSIVDSTNSVGVSAGPGSSPFTGNLLGGTDWTFNGSAMGIYALANNLAPATLKLRVTLSTSGTPTVKTNGGYLGYYRIV